MLQDFSETADDEISDFLQIVARFITNCYIIIIDSDSCNILSCVL